MDIIALFCEIDDFLLLFEKWLPRHALPLREGKKKRKRRRCLCASEVMTILVYFHQSQYRTLSTTLSKKSVSISAGHFQNQ